MRLRLKSPSGIHTFGDTLTPESTLYDLKQQIQLITSIPVGSQSLKIGFPPKIIQVNDTVSIEECGIKNGEQIVVEGQAALHATTAEPPKISEKGVQVKNGYLVVREMKDDNSCLFRSVGYVCIGDSEPAASLRKIAANIISQDPVKYPDVVLGRTRSEYIDWIQQPKSWGGAIELSLFSEYYQTEIVSIDVSTLRMDRFNQGKYPSLVMVLYSGIHYDAIALSHSYDSPKEFDQTSFNVDSPDTIELLDAAMKLAAEWKKKHKFTDLGSFTLRCVVCKIGLKGQMEAQQHAVATGHTSFAEY